MGHLGANFRLRFQVIFYVISVYSPSSLGLSTDPNVPFNSRLLCSYLIYDPRKRLQAWRFITYMFLHGSDMHIVTNATMALFVGKSPANSPIPHRSANRLYFRDSPGDVSTRFDGFFEGGRALHGWCSIGVCRILHL